MKFMACCPLYSVEHSASFPRARCGPASQPSCGTGSACSGCLQTRLGPPNRLPIALGRETFPFEDQSRDARVERALAVKTCDVAVVGAGPTGIAAALALAHVGADVALIGPAPPKANAARPETRTAALLTSSVDFLKRLNVWDELVPHAAPLKVIRIVDASRSLLRSPDIAFEARELGLVAFGYNICQHGAHRGALCPCARRLAQDHSGERRADRRLRTARRILTLSGGRTRSRPGSWPARTGGDRSAVKPRASRSIEWRYDQGAIATSFRHTRPTMASRPNCTGNSAPSPRCRCRSRVTSSLIWVGTATEIDALMAVRRRRVRRRAPGPARRHARRDLRCRAARGIPGRRAYR